MEDSLLAQFRQTALSVKSPNMLPWAGTTTDMDIIYQVKKAVAFYISLYVNPKTVKDDLNKCASSLEALLITQKVVSPAEKEISDKLIEILHKLQDKRIFP